MSDICFKLKELFQKFGGVEFAYLFGSYAKDEISPISDIDIAVYLNPSCDSFDDELGLHSFLSKGLKSDKIDLIIINRVKNIMLLDDIVRYGKVVYDKNPSLREHFELRVLHDAIDFKYQRKVFAGR